MDHDDNPRPRGPRKRLVIFAVVILIIVAIILFGYNAFYVARFG